MEPYLTADIQTCSKDMDCHDGNRYVSISKSIRLPLRCSIVFTSKSFSSSALMDFKLYTRYMQR